MADLESFLAARKLTAEDLEQSRSQAAPLPANLLMSEERNNEARAHLNAYPLDTNDVQRERMHMLTTFFTNMQDSCYDKCAEDNDFTFLSIREGKCFRNCITKVSYYYPTLKTNLKDASFR